MSTPRPTKVTPLSGFPEYLPEQRIVEQHFLDVIQAQASGRVDERHAQTSESGVHRGVCAGELFAVAAPR